jgi:hypothetical protein
MKALSYYIYTFLLYIFVSQRPKRPPSESATIQTLSLLALLAQKYKYWYKSTNTDACHPIPPALQLLHLLLLLLQVLSFLALLVQKYKY